MSLQSRVDSESVNFLIVALALYLFIVKFLSRTPRRGGYAATFLRGPS